MTAERFCTRKTPANWALLYLTRRPPLKEFSSSIIISTPSAGVYGVWGAPNEVLECVNPQTEKGFTFPLGVTSQYALKFSVWPITKTYFPDQFYPVEDQVSEHTIYYGRLRLKKAIFLRWNLIRNIGFISGPKAPTIYIAISVRINHGTLDFSRPIFKNQSASVQVGRKKPTISKSGIQTTPRPQLGIIPFNFASPARKRSISTTLKSSRSSDRLAPTHVKEF